MEQQGQSLIELPSPSLVNVSERVLVTGSSGFIGVRLVAALIDAGFTDVRCFVRPSSNLDRLRAEVRSAGDAARVEILSGDLLSRSDCSRAAEGAALVFHLAAGFDKSFAGAFMNSALTTRNLLDAVLECGALRRFVNVSSFAVYSNWQRPRGCLLDETSPLQDAPQARYDAYGYGKLKQEQLVGQYGRTRGLPYVILRPGVVFGPGKKDLSGRIGIDTFGIFMHIGGSNILPLTFVDNCAEAILLAGVVPGIEGEVFNIVDDDLLTSAEFIAAYRKRVRRFACVRVPYWTAYAMSVLWEEYSRRSRGQLPPAFNRRRCVDEWNGNRYSNKKLREKLGWRPRVGMREALAAFLQQFTASVS